VRSFLHGVPSIFFLYGIKALEQQVVDMGHDNILKKFTTKDFQKMNMTTIHVDTH
jgi:hypothetical protein